ncbi:hypothetical protein [Candidatus Thiothrix anitrata]|uniref:Transmembrane protein n=1 Tax=Candidatus Thiothrix anitrata TaxID=2823902 RepID=A0ABX7X2C5_9GAMM|nr:hypothetical protein [Candidatus Thiothrix anitrata]QTR48818.1 hypothetical protein J8380_11040 [Candidatus Thiothrix anitrata]
MLMTAKLPLPHLGLFLGSLVWIIALFLPVFHTTNGVVMGYWVLATGWMGFMVFQFAWYANLLELLGILLISRRPNWAMGLAVAGILLAGQAFWFEEIPRDTGTMHVVRLGLGFWLWYVGLLLITFSVIFGVHDDENIAG